MGKYCQFNEEEIITKIFEEIGTTNKQAVEFGCHADGLYSNILFLEDWEKKMFSDEQGKGIVTKWITAENINQVMRDNGVLENCDLMSIDIDGNDYWVWKALELEPRVIIIEYNVNKECGVMNYDAEYKWRGFTEFGATAYEMIQLAKSKGYKLYECNQANLFFIKQ